MGFSAGLSAAATSSGIAASTGNPTVALEAQLQRCNKELGEWAGCDSAKTPQGRKIIQTLEIRIGNLKSRIAEASNNPDSSTKNPGGDTARASAGRPAIDTLGAFVDVFA